MSSWKISAAAILLSVAPAGLSWLPENSGAAAATDLRIAGHWVRDAAASDNFEGKLAKLMQQRQRRFRPAPPVNNDLPPLVMPVEEGFDRTRLQLRETLKPADDLRLSFNGTAFEVLADDQPMRTLVLGQPVTRLDATGSSEVTAGWSGSTLEIRSRYARGATRTHRYVLDRSGELLQVTLAVSDPEIGKFELRSTYRLGN